MYCGAADATDTGGGAGGATAAVRTGASAVVWVGNKVVAVVIDDEDCARPAGGVQPGGGSKALFGSAVRTGADATGGGAETVSAGGAMGVVVTLLVALGGVGAALAIWLEGVATVGDAGVVGNNVLAVAIDEVEVAGVGGTDAEVGAAAGAAAAVTTGALCPGGTHPGGGSNALLGSIGRAGAVATCAVGAVSAGVATDDVGVAAVVAVTGGMGVAVTGAGGVAAATCGDGSDEAVDEEVVDDVAEGAGAGAPAAAASSALRSAT